MTRKESAGATATGWPEWGQAAVAIMVENLPRRACRASPGLREERVRVMQEQKQDSRRHPRADARSADGTGFKPVALPALRAAMNAAAAKPPRPKGHHGVWMLHEDALIG